MALINEAKEHLSKEGVDKIDDVYEYKLYDS